MTRAAFTLMAVILWPAPAPLYRLRGRFRRRILIKSASRSELRRLIVAWRDQRDSSSVREAIDIDPLDMS